MFPSKPHELAREAMLIRHMFIFAVETVPPDQQLGSTRPVRPVFVLEELLAHKNHRNARCRQHKSGGHLGPATRVPRTCIGRISERSDARLTVAAAVIEIEQVVVLDALKDSPARGVFVSQVKAIAQPVEVDASVAAAGGFSDDLTQ